MSYCRYCAVTLIQCEEAGLAKTRGRHVENDVMYVCMAKRIAINVWRCWVQATATCLQGLDIEADSIAEHRLHSSKGCT